MTVILLGSVMVFLNFMTGVAWAGLAGTIVSGYFGLAGWTSSAELKTGTTLASLRSRENESSNP